MSGPSEHCGSISRLIITVVSCSDIEPGGWNHRAQEGAPNIPGIWMDGKGSLRKSKSAVGMARSIQSLTHRTPFFLFFTRDSDPPTLCPEVRKKKNTLTPSCQPDTYMWQDRDVLYHHTATWMLSTLARSTLSSVRSVLDILLHHQWPQWKSLFCCFVIFR